jgi:hypothetical protein
LDEGLVPAVAAVVGRPGSDAAESVGLGQNHICGTSIRGTGRVGSRVPEGKIGFEAGFRDHSCETMPMWKGLS